MIIKVKCVACKTKGTIKTYEGNPVTCPYCKGTGKRDKTIPHRSHRMSKWRSEIRCPGSEPRFYGVRHCTKCGEEELSHPAGHFMDGLIKKCPKAA